MARKAGIRLLGSFKGLQIRLWRADTTIRVVVPAGQASKANGIDPRSLKAMDILLKNLN
jgi:hypothetical protein